MSAYFERNWFGNYGGDNDMFSALASNFQQEPWRRTKNRSDRSSTIWKNDGRGPYGGAVWPVSLMVIVCLRFRFVTVFAKGNKAYVQPVAVTYTTPMPKNDTKKSNGKIAGTKGVLDQFRFATNTKKYVKGRTDESFIIIDNYVPSLTTCISYWWMYWKPKKAVVKSTLWGIVSVTNEVTIRTTFGGGSTKSHYYFSRARFTRWQKRILVFVAEVDFRVWKNHSICWAF